MTPPSPAQAPDAEPCEPRGYRRAVAGVGALLLAGALVRLFPALGSLEPAFWLVTGLVLLTELRPLRAPGGRDGVPLTLSSAFVLAVLLRYGLPAALVVQAAGTALSELVRRRPAAEAALALGQHALAWGAAGLVMHLAGARAGAGDPLDLTGPDLSAAAAGALTAALVARVLAARVAAWRTGTPVLRVLRRHAGYQVLTSVALLALSPLVCLAVGRGAAFVPLLLPPLLAVYAVASVALDREQRALSDALTGLPNRPMFQQRAAAALREGEAALVLFDLDRFKEVNDTLGHHVGDRLLQVVADRLALAVRSCDTIARLGGDEFALVLPGVPDAESARATAERLRLAVCEPIVLEGLLLDVGASAGVAVSPTHGSDVETLLQHADVAMYLAKESGTVEVYDPARDRNSPSRLSMLGELRRAVELGELELHYQPAVALSDSAVAGVEALVRWRHPERGLVLPDEFVPLAERSGLIQSLTAWVIDAALAQLATWQAEGFRFRMSVNVSVKDLCGDALAGQVERGLQRYGIAAEQLQLEVTEGSLLADPVRAASTLARLAELGVGLSLDDFGTGYSSLSHLRRLPVREIKVDRSFVRSMDDRRDLAVVRSVVDLGRGLGMSVVAEGVEDALAFHRLAAMGCDVAQGWFVSHALPADELTIWLHRREAAVTLPA